MGFNAFTSTFICNARMNSLNVIVIIESSEKLNLVPKQTHTKPRIHTY